ncbi:AraC family transcriptional regulator [Ancylomarina sp. 16SWW S1-10-2]|uniref:helix-turn-helix domain-containing protein n=1 Tax=Ancylomarina sp. 16SWW S1-10-2 TaxID=2499681 RepID=UPI0012AE791E|nr:response regulator transcription factor [Ancylomarina sp. 16SWW S1-10-2]MRT92892.1 AraC family transcriptional regulator [Ancylomarina sp. 16SWW S1-10-2]
MKDIHRLETISQVCDFFNIEKPKHPLVTVIPHGVTMNESFSGKTVVTDLYQVILKPNVDGSFSYGRNTYDFQEGTLVFIKPGQVITIPHWNDNKAEGGWVLLFHPDLIRKSELGKHIDDYSFFSYDSHEALHLSDEEKKELSEITEKIKKEYSQNIDKHSQKLIISNIELILDYSTRFYDRQFYTRTNLNKDIVSRFEQLLKDYYNSDKQLVSGLPTVNYCGTELHMSSNYLGDMLKKETGRNALEHIHFYVIEKAKTQLLSSSEPVGQIGYSLGFEYPQHFSKIFKKKVGMTPAKYRSMN